MKFKDRTILITGGAGFIGSNLCDELIQKNPKKLIIFDNLCQSCIENIKHLLKDKRVEFVYGDVRDYDSIYPVVMESDFIFHLAASNIGMSTIKPKIDLETNIIGTFNLLTAAKENPLVRIVHASSGSVLGSSDKPMKEDSILNPTTPYAISKMSGEKYAKFFADEYGVKVSIIRYFHVFGPKQDYSGKSGVINIFLNRILRNKQPIIWGTGEQIKCFTFVKDTIKATILLSENDKTIGEIYNVASDNRISIKELSEFLIKKYAKNKDLKPIFISPKVGENMNPIPDTTKIKSLEWKTEYTFEEGIDISKKWVKSTI